MVFVCIRHAGLTDFMTIAIKPGELRDAADIGPIDEYTAVGNGELRPARYVKLGEAVDNHKRLSSDAKRCSIERLCKQASYAYVKQVSTCVLHRRSGLYQKFLHVGIERSDINTIAFCVLADRGIKKVSAIREKRRPRPRSRLILELRHKGWRTAGGGKEINPAEVVTLMVDENRSSEAPRSDEAPLR
jgi:hypothetical protein